MVFARHQHESVTGIHVSPHAELPHPLPCPPYLSRLSQCSGFGSPASFIELTLFICFTNSNVYVSMLFSQIIPPSPSPTESRSLFFMEMVLRRTDIVHVIMELTVTKQTFNV